MPSPHKGKFITDFLGYTGASVGANGSTQQYILASTEYVEDSVRSILEPLQPIEPLEASVGFYYIIGKDEEDKRKDIVLPDRPYVDKLVYVSFANSKLYTEDRLASFEEQYTPYIKSYINCSSSRMMEASLRDAESLAGSFSSSVQESVLKKIDEDVAALQQWVQNSYQIDSINRVDGWQQEVLDVVLPHCSTSATQIGGITGAVTGGVEHGLIQSTLNSQQKLTDPHLTFEWSDLGALNFKAKKSFSTHIINDNGSFITSIYSFNDNSITNYHQLSPYLYQDFTERTWNFYNYKFLNVKVDIPINDDDIANKKYVDSHAGVPYDIVRENASHEHIWNVQKYPQSTATDYAFTYKLNLDGLKTVTDQVIYGDASVQYIRGLGSQAGTLFALEKWRWSGRETVSRMTIYDSSKNELSSYHYGKHYFNNNIPECAFLPTSGNQLANKKYVDSHAGVPYDIVRENASYQQIWSLKGYGTSRDAVYEFRYNLEYPKVNAFASAIRWGSNVAAVRSLWQLSSSTKLQYGENWSIGSTQKLLRALNYDQPNNEFYSWHYGHHAFMDHLPRSNALPNATNCLVHKHYVDATSIRVGCIVAWILNSYPYGPFLPCNGMQVSKYEFEELYNLLKGTVHEFGEDFLLPRLTPPSGIKVWLIYTGKYLDSYSSVDSNALQPNDLDAIKTAKMVSLPKDNV